MDTDVLSSSQTLVKCCGSGSSSTESWLRSVKRKCEEGNQLSLTGVDCESPSLVQIENECDVLREMVYRQQMSIKDLYTELEEERGASASAANEAMSMIVRLQREKADTQMEARQFKRYAEEKMIHDHWEILTLEDVLYKREEMIESLACEVQAYRHRMMSYGLTEDEVDSLEVNHEYLESQLDSATYKCRPLICDANETCEGGSDDLADIEKYECGETPRNREYLKNLESRISHLERNPKYDQLDGDVFSAHNVVEKIIVGYSPRETSHSRKLSSDSSCSQVIKELGPDLTQPPRHYRSSRETEFVSEIEENLRRMDVASEAGDDRIYTIDSVHNGTPLKSDAEAKNGGGSLDEYASPPKESSNYADISNPDINKLYMRLQALEDERESMRQALLSMRTDKVQLMFVKELAQRLCNEVAPERRMSLKKMPVQRSFSFLSVCKWMMSFIFWRGESHRNEYALGSSAVDEGMQLIQDKCPRMKQWRCLTSTQPQEASLSMLASKFIA